MLDAELLDEAARMVRERDRATWAIDLQGRLAEICRGPKLDRTIRYQRRGGIPLSAQESAAGIRIATGEQDILVLRRKLITRDNQKQLPQRGVVNHDRHSFPSQYIVVRMTSRR